jgi:hypothetical protein
LILLDVLPFIELRAVDLGGVRIRTFGAAMTIGIIVGHTLFVLRARRR